MDPRHVEFKAERLADDLTHGYQRDACNLLREELMHDPREALAVINLATHMKPPHTVEDVVRTPNGMIGVVDHRNGHIDFAGRDPYSQLNQYNQYNNYGDRHTGPVIRNHDYQAQQPCPDGRYYPNVNPNIYTPNGCFGDQNIYPNQTYNPGYYPNQVYAPQQIYSPGNTSILRGPAGVTVSESPAFPPTPGVAQSMGDLNAIFGTVLPIVNAGAGIYMGIENANRHHR